ncbi:GGDEF domain-containing protein [Halomonas sp. PAMB 3264]|uniref:GGDEF domain-containing protein n=1 Tax=Halomonas sp. PAMB 3264 TaxID=3075222 RepID=UPI002896D20A|nr:GGDEF domain-containing protein [Halomonas sp. PAMB 3264]WNL41415.1 GGDEF domain-containing protein [Halomonas sp. PAMB 3264]
MVIEEDRYRIHRLTGQLCDSDLETAYRHSIQQRLSNEYSLALGIGAFIFGIYVLSDYFLLGLALEFFLLLALRLAVVSTCLLIAFKIRRGKIGVDGWYTLPLWLLATGIILIVPLRPESFSTQIIAAVVAVLGFYLFIPNRLTVVTLVSLYLTSGFLVALVAFTDANLVDVTRTAILLLTANVIGFSTLLRMESLQRVQFALLNNERGRNQALNEEIISRKLLEEQLRTSAERDALTNLNNRGHFMKLAGKMLQRSQSGQAPFSLFMIDVDHFKRINDTCGHCHGDKVLAEIAEVCEESLRPTDVIGRFGGEEFIVALPNTNLDDAQKVAERLKREVSNLSLPDEMGTQSPSVTIGVAAANAEGENLDALIKQADQLLYIGKRAGRNQVVVGRDGDGPNADEAV